MSARRASLGYRRLAALAAVLCLAVTAVAGCGAAAAPHRARATRSSAAVTQRDFNTARPTDTTTRRAAVKAPRQLPRQTPLSLSVYAGPGNAGGVRAADHSLDGAVTGAFDYLPDTSWEAISDPVWLEQQWAGENLKLTLAVPMLPNSGASLAGCAGGSYDHYFTYLARTLVRGGLADSTLAIGWEPETGGYAWTPHNPVQGRAYVQCWRHVRGALADVPGTHFVFLWDAGDPRPGDVPLAQLYPGNGYVNIISTSALDGASKQIPAAYQWSSQTRWRYGANWAARFATAHRKQLAMFMLGMDGADNGTYVKQMLRWAVSHHAVAVNVWDYAGNALLSSRFRAVTAALLAARVSGELRAGPVQARP